MAKKRMLADVLWEAANVRLSPENVDFDETPLYYSCNAVIAAERGKRFERADIRRTHLGEQKCKSFAYLQALGCDPNISHSFNDFKEGATRQGVRYMWLLLAMHVAADEGIEL